MIAFLHSHLVAMLLAVSGVLVAGATAFVVHHVVNRHDHSRKRANKHAEPRWTRFPKRKARRRQAR